MEKLTFLDTFSVAKFKKAQETDELEVRENEATGKKSLMIHGKVVGAVSDGYQEKPVVSLVEGNNGKFFLLHKQGEGLKLLDTL